MFLGLFGVDKATPRIQRGLRRLGVGCSFELEGEFPTSEIWPCTAAMDCDAAKLTCIVHWLFHGVVLQGSSGHAESRCKLTVEGIPHFLHQVGRQRFAPSHLA